jgi:FlaA1/EpsC-like NDP-sugar epimerase
MKETIQWYLANMDWINNIVSGDYANIMKRCMRKKFYGGKKMFKNKTLLITGGTGSFGQSCPESFSSTDIGEMHILSREKTQDDMVSCTRTTK